MAATARGRKEGWGTNKDRRLRSSGEERRGGGAMKRRKERMMQRVERGSREAAVACVEEGISNKGEEREGDEQVFSGKKEKEQMAAASQ